MPSVQIDIIAGRSTEQKKALVKELTQAVVNALDVEPQRVRVRINEIQKENTARGGVLRSEE